MKDCSTGVKRVRITRADDDVWYKIGEEYDVLGTALPTCAGYEYHPLVDDKNIGIGVGDFEVIEEQPKFPFKVRCIDNSFGAEGELVEGQIYNVLREYMDGDYILEGVQSSWNMCRFEIIKEDNMEKAVQIKEELQKLKASVDEQVAATDTTRNKYMREIKPGVWVDVYDVLRAWEVTDPCLQHLLKKALQPGKRHHKDLKEDLQDILASAKRAVEMFEEWNK